MIKILVAVDGSEASQRVIEHLIGARAEYRDAPEVHLLNVQHPLPGGTGRALGKAQVADYHHEEGTRALAPARARLDAAGVAYRHHIGVGDDAGRVIAQFARDHHCNRVLMGTRGLGAVGGMLLGSVATRVLHLVEVPVVLVK